MRIEEHEVHAYLLLVVAIEIYWMSNMLDKL
jgi:hypothetical protein